ncbi:MAG: efflux RND transporter periplasmic adaptor subunit, partial [Thiohalorhabdaceae bacterium]
MTPERNRILALALLLAGTFAAVPAWGAADKHAGEGESHSQGPAHKLHLSQEQRGRLDLKIGKAAAGSAEGTLTMPATVHFDQDRVAKVGPRLRAKVVRVTKDLGTRVAQGETV